MVSCFNCGKEGLQFPENWVPGMKVTLIDPQSERAHVCDMRDVLRFRPPPRTTMKRKCSSCGNYYPTETWCPDCFIEVQYLQKMKIEITYDELGRPIANYIDLPESEWEWVTTIRFFDDVKEDLKNPSGYYRLPPD